MCACVRVYANMVHICRSLYIYTYIVSIQKYANEELMYVCRYMGI